MIIFDDDIYNSDFIFPGENTFLYCMLQRVQILAIYRSTDAHQVPFDAIWYT